MQSSIIAVPIGRGSQTGFCFCPQAAPCPKNTLMEDMYTNGSATLGSPAHANGREVRKVRFIQFEKATEEPMVSLGGVGFRAQRRVALSCLRVGRRKG